MKKNFVWLMIACMVLLSACGGGSSVKELSEEDIKQYTSQMSDALCSGEFTLNGTKMTAPFHAKDFTAIGLHLEDVKEDALPAFSKTANGISMNNGKGGTANSIRVDLENVTGKEVKLEDALVTKVLIESCEKEQSNTIVLPKGITLASTYDEIISAYGEPTVNYLKETGFIIYTDTKTKVSVQFDFADDQKALESIRITAL